MNHIKSDLGILPSKPWNGRHTLGARVDCIFPIFKTKIFVPDGSDRSYLAAVRQRKCVSSQLLPLGQPLGEESTSAVAIRRVPSGGWDRLPIRGLASAGFGSSNRPCRVFILRICYLLLVCIHLGS